MNRYTCIISDGDGLGVGLCRPIGNVMQQANRRDVGPYPANHAKSVSACFFINAERFWPPAPTMGPRDVFIPGSIARSRSAAYAARVEAYASTMKAAVDLARQLMPSVLIGVYHEDFPLRPGNGIAYGGDPTSNDADHARLVRMGVNGGADFVLVGAYLHVDHFPWMTPKQAGAFVTNTIRNAQALGPVKLALQPFLDRPGDVTTPTIAVPADHWAALCDAGDATGVDRVFWMGMSNRAELKRVEPLLKRFLE